MPVPFIPPFIRPEPTRQSVGPSPDPRELYRLRQWVNAYGGMDYVGRALWLRPPGEEAPVYGPERQSYWGGKAIEVCIGDVAHTHYWDTGSRIARYLHEIIEHGSFAQTEPVGAREP